MISSSSLLLSLLSSSVSVLLCYANEIKYTQNSTQSFTSIPFFNSRSLLFSSSLSLPLSMALQVLAPLGMMALFHQGIGLVSGHWNVRSELEKSVNWEEILEEFDILPKRTHFAPYFPPDSVVDFSIATNEPVIDPAAHSYIVPGSENDPYKRRSRPIPLSSYGRPFLQLERYEDNFHNPANVRKYGTVSRLEAVARDPSVLRRDPKAFVKMMNEETYSPFENYWPLLSSKQRGNISGAQK